MGFWHLAVEAGDSLNTLQHAGEAPPQRVIRPQISLVPRPEEGTEAGSMWEVVWEDACTSAGPQSLGESLPYRLLWTRGCPPAPRWVPARTCEQEQDRPWAQQERG